MTFRNISKIFFWHDFGCKSTYKSEEHPAVAVFARPVLIPFRDNSWALVFFIDASKDTIYTFSNFRARDLPWTGPSDCIYRPHN